MSEANKAVVKRYIHELWAPGGEKVVNEIISPEFVFHHLADPSKDVRGTGMFTQMGPIMRERIEHVETTIDDIVADGDKVVVRSTQRTKHKAGAYRGLDTTGKETAVASISVFSVRDGKITDVWAIQDEITMMRQLVMMHKSFQNSLLNIFP